VTVEALAVSDRSGDGVMLFSKTGDKLACLQEVGGYYADASATRRCQVPVVSLDDYVDAAGLSRMDLIKIDVQGAELFVLRGMSRALRQLRPIVIAEITGEEMFHQAHELLSAYGYRISCLEQFPVPGTADQRYRNILGIPTPEGTRITTDR